MEGVRAERHAADVVRRLVGRRVVAMAAVGSLDRLRLHLEGLARECPVGDDGGPPARDRVPSQLEHGRIVPERACPTAAPR